MRIMRHAVPSPHLARLVHHDKVKLQRGAGSAVDALSQHAGSGAATYHHAPCAKLVWRQLEAAQAAVHQAVGQHVLLGLW